MHTNSSNHHPFCPTSNTVNFNDGGSHNSSTRTDKFTKTTPTATFSEGWTVNITNGSELTLGQQEKERLIGPWYDIDDNTCSIPCRERFSAVAVYEQSSLHVDIDVIVDGGPNFSDARKAATGILCHGAGSSVQLGSAANSMHNSSSITRIRGGNLTYNEPKAVALGYDGNQKPGKGIEILDGCHLNAYNENAVVTAGVWRKPTTKKKKKKKKMEEYEYSYLQFTPAVSIERSTATFFGGTFVGKPALMIKNSNVTIYGGNFIFPYTSSSSNHNKKKRNNDWEDDVWNFALQLYATYDGSVNVDIYGGTYEGEWVVGLTGSINFVVHGRGLVLTKDPQPHCVGALRLVGTLCDNTPISVLVTDRWGELTLMDDCKGGDTNTDVVVVPSLSPSFPEIPAVKDHSFSLFRQRYSWVIMIAVVFPILLLLITTWKRRNSNFYNKFQALTTNNHSKDDEDDDKPTALTTIEMC